MFQLQGTVFKPAAAALKSSSIILFWNGSDRGSIDLGLSRKGDRIDNMTDWGLTQFQTHYNDPTITKLVIFHYTYAVLHHPAYRTKYELNLNREFPRLPYSPKFHQWDTWGKALMELHRPYNYPLTSSA